MTALPPSLWRRIVNTWRHNRRKSRYVVDMTDDGFVFTARRRETRVRWDDVMRIDAGVRDCLTFDVVYFQIHSRTATIYIEELDEGFRQFEHTVLARWPEIRGAWEELQKAELFAAQHRTLWRRGE